MKKTKNIFKLSLVLVIAILFVNCAKTPEFVIPTVVTGDAINIAHATVTLPGEVTDMGGTVLLASGFIWGPDETALTDSTATVTFEETVDGVFESNVTGLAPNFTYYYRAYAFNSVGSVYGDIKSFKTLLK